MKFSITAILIVLTAFSQAQDTAVVPKEVTDGALLLPDVPALKVPANGRAIPYDRKKARSVRLSGARPMNSEVKVQSTPVIKLATAKPARALTPFERRMLNDWDSPHGEAMNTLLKDIKAAKEAGDIKTYDILTARYTAWAGKYLSRGAKPANKQNP
jgi:hypothetical protein